MKDENNLTKSHKKLGLIQLRILYWLYVPSDMGGIGYTPINIINKCIKVQTYSSLKSLCKQGYVGIAHSDIFHKEVYFITDNGKDIFEKNIKGLWKREIKQLLNVKQLIVCWD